MPAPELEWKSYEVSAHARDATHALETVALTKEQFPVKISDLRAWPGPRDKAMTCSRLLPRGERTARCVCNEDG